jgi:cation diffusion facilitator family transporter
MIQFITQNMAPLMFASLIVVMLFGYPVAFALAADTANHRIDVYTAVGVLTGLLLVRLTGHTFFDPLLAILVALLIVSSTWRLINSALATLMDTHLPAADIATVRDVLHNDPSVLGYHKLRTRIAGSVRHVDAHVLVVQQRVARTDQEYEGEQIPLNFQPFVRARIERISNNGIAGTDQDCGEDQPVGEFPDAFAQRVDKA